MQSTNYTILVTVKTENGTLTKPIKFNDIEYIKPRLGGCEIYTVDEDGIKERTDALEEFEEVAKRIKAKNKE